jgi:hypothetical protein
MKLMGLTVVLSIGLAVIVAVGYRVDVAKHWEERRCEPGVVPIAGFFKPALDTRSPSEFARANWSFCQKRYVVDAIRAAAAVPKELAAAEAAVVGGVQEIASDMADVFHDVWNFCYQAYSTFMDKMRGVAKLFQNFMINLYGIVNRLHGAVISIAYSLISLLVAFINSVQVALMVAVIVIGILIALQIILFFLLLPISGLIVTVTAIVSVVVVSIATAISATKIAEMFTPGVCFAAGTAVRLADGTTKPIDSLATGTVLGDGGRVTAVHRFRSADQLYVLHGIEVTGDHLVVLADGSLRPVRDHPDAEPVDLTVGDWLGGGRELWCLTTTTRRIPLVTAAGTDMLFADWEEIEAEDEEGLVAWYREVWRTLNGVHQPVLAPQPRVLRAEAGLAPDCHVVCVDWLGRRSLRRIMDVAVGDRVVCGASGESTTRVVGKVRLAGDQSTDAVRLPDGGIVSCATWTSDSGRSDSGGRTLWTPAANAHPVCELHPTHWEHLYTASGDFWVGDCRVRDASDVGLEGLRTLVDDVVLPTKKEHHI